MYVGYKAVISALEDEYGSLISTNDHDKILRLIARGILIKGDVEAFNLVQNYKVDIHNGIGELPCFLYRLLRTTSKSFNGQFTVNVEGNYLKPSFMNGTLYIDYYELPWQEVNGRKQPLIKNYLVEYLVAYCVKALFKAKFLAGEINQAQWAEIKDTFHGLLADNSIAFAINNSMDDIEQALFLQRNSMYFTPQMYSQ